MDNYKKYMKTTVDKSNKTTKKLKKQLNWWKQKAKDAGVSEECPV